MVVMKRYLEKYIQKDLKRKIVLLTGPRQTGKTTLAKMLSHHFDYCPPRGMGEKPSPSGEDFSRLAVWKITGSQAIRYTT